MPATADAQGWIRCGGLLPSGAPCRNILWRLDGVRIRMRIRVRGGYRWIDHAARGAHTLAVLCERCGTWWRPSPDGEPVAPPEPSLDDVPEPLRTRLLNPPPEPAPGLNRPAPFSTVVWADGKPYRRPEPDEAVA